jgi:hypothetical protein
MPLLLIACSAPPEPCPEPEVVVERVDVDCFRQSGQAYCRVDRRDGEGRSQGSAVVPVVESEEPEWEE